MNLETRLAFLIESGEDLELEYKIHPVTSCLFYFNNFYAEVFNDAKGKPFKITVFKSMRRLDQYLNKININSVNRIAGR